MSTQVDPWIDPDFPNVDLSRHPEDAELADGVVQDDETLEPEVVTNVVPPTPAPAPVPVAAEPEEETPETFDLKGGGQGSIEKTKKGWCVSIDVGVGGVQKFYGKTKNEALVNMANAQANATRRIRELNRQVKLGTGSDTPAQPAAAPVAKSRQLTADEKFEFKTKFEADPDAAIEEWFRKRSGRTLETLVEKADKGDAAARELEMEAVHKGFLAACPSYYGDPGYENYKALVGYLAKNKLGRALTNTNRDEIVNELLAKGQYTAENLEEAFTDLNDSGLLLEKPREATPLTPPQPPAAPAPSGERIVRTETRPRAGLGIRTREATPTPPPATPKALSAEDFENLSTEEIDKLIARESARIRAGRR